MKNVEFYKSFSEVSEIHESYPQVVVLGRSNAGKSSCINNMLGRSNKLAFVSNTPGRTQLLNFFLVDKSWLMVDVPGYGYASVPGHKRRKMVTRVHEYLDQQKMHIALALLLLDAKVGVTDEDMDMINHLHAEGIPRILVMNKVDKIGKNLAREQLKQFQKTFDKDIILPHSDSDRALGLEILKKIENTLNLSTIPDLPKQE